MAALQEAFDADLSKLRQERLLLACDVKALEARQLVLQKELALLKVRL